MALISRSTLALIALAIGCGIAQGNDVYIAPSATGATNGISCSSALPVSFFNAKANWTSGTPSGAMIGPGTTVHLCGGTYTFSGGTSCGLSFQGGGASGAVVTLIADQGAVAITAPYWAGSANGGPICSIGYSYVTINGDNNLILQATANGSAFPNHADYAFGVWALTGDQVTIENLTISNIYVHVQCVAPYTNCDEGGQNTGGIAAEGSNVTISGNTIHDAKWCITGGVAGNTTIANRTISNNTIYNCDHGIAVGVAGNNGVLNGLRIHDNDISNFINWDDSPSVNSNHHDGIHVWSYNTGDSITGALVYNNYIHGDWGASWNSGLYVEALTGLPTAYYFSNLLTDQSTVSHLGCGVICALSNGISILNNTIDSSRSVNGGVVAIHNYGTGVSVENNIVIGAGQAIAFNTGSTYVIVDYNLYYDIGSQGWGFSTFAGWRTSCKCDLHSSNTNPNLSSTYMPTSASAAVISQGVNLSALSLAQLDLDKSGAARPPSPKNWDVGAYQYQPGGSAPTAPTGLTAVSH